MQEYARLALQFFGAFCDADGSVSEDQCLTKLDAAQTQLRSCGEVVATKNDLFTKTPWLGPITQASLWEHEQTHVKRARAFGIPAGLVQSNIGVGGDGFLVIWAVHLDIESLTKEKDEKGGLRRVLGEIINAPTAKGLDYPFERCVAAYLLSDSVSTRPNLPLLFGDDSQFEPTSKILRLIKRLGL